MDFDQSVATFSNQNSGETGSPASVNSFTTSEDQLVMKLMRYISEHELLQGSKLPSIRELADEWDATPSVVRSALIKASVLGLIEMKPRSGSYVRAIDFSYMISWYTLLFETTLHLQHPNLLDLYDLKTVLEAGMFHTAAQTRTPEDVFSLKKILLALGTKDHTKDRVEIVELDEQFHIAVARMTRNPLYEALLSAIQAMLREERLSQDFYEQHFNEQTEDHRRLFEAIRDGVAEEAETVAKKHSERRKESLLQL